MTTKKHEVPQELLASLLADYKKPEDLIGENGLLMQLTKLLVERALDAELTEHLGHERNEAVANPAGNTRNGKSRKTLKGDFGELPIEVPRDRHGSFEPQLIPKHQTRWAGFDDKIISLYARGMTVREIQSHLQEMYGTEVSTSLISSVTDAVSDEVKAWQARPLEALYPIVYLDCIHVKVREGSVRVKAVYLAIGITMQGNKEVLGLWLAQTEGAKFWLQVVTERRNRGVQDIFIACVDGLKGFPEAIEAVFPKTVVQLCIVHMVRHSLNYVSWKRRKEVAADLRRIYAAATLDEAELMLGEFEEKWDQEYLPIGQSLRRNCCRTAQMHRPCPARALDGATTPSSPLPCQRQAHLGPKASPRHALQETWRRHAGNGTLPSRHRQRGCAGSDQARRLLLAQLGMKRLYRYVLKE